MTPRGGATGRGRPAGPAATADTTPVTSGLRISVSTTTPSRRIVGCSGSVPLESCASSATFATASASPGSMPACRTAHVTARYMAPVSRYRAPSAAASRRDTVDLPEPEGPSTATTHRSTLALSRTPPHLTPVHHAGRGAPAGRRVSRATRRWRGSRRDGVEERGDLAAVQPPGPAWLQVTELDRPDGGTHEARHRVPALGQEPPHDVLAPFVDFQLDEYPTGDRVDDPERVDPRRPVLQLHAGQQLPAQPAPDRTGHLGEVRLGHAVGRVGEAVGQRAVVPSGQAPLTLRVQPVD